MGENEFRLEQNERQIEAKEAAWESNKERNKREILTFAARIIRREVVDEVYKLAFNPLYDSGWCESEINLIRGCIISQAKHVDAEDTHIEMCLACAINTSAYCLFDCEVEDLWVSGEKASKELLEEFR